MSGRTNDGGAVNKRTTWLETVAMVTVAMVAAVGMLFATRRPPVRIRTLHIPVGEVTLEGDLFLPRHSARCPVVLLLHGSCPEGRTLPLYPALARELCRRGCVVLNMDQRGHGGSTPPPRIRAAADLDFVGDAVRVSEALVSLAGVKRPTAVVLVGHSFGGGVAVVAGLRSAAVTHVVGISPGRRLEERFLAPGREAGLAYAQRRKSNDMRLDQLIPLDVVAEVVRSYDIGQLRGRSLVKPLLIVEGALEPAKDLAFSEALAASMQGPVARHVLPNADHYYGFMQATEDRGRQWIVSDEEVVDRLAHAIMQWLKEGL